MKACSVPSCGRPRSGKHWCATHYMRWWKTGDVRADEPIRESVGPSPVSVCGGIALVRLSNGTVAVVSAEDSERVARGRWHYMGRGYVVGDVDGRRVVLHRWLLDAPTGVLVDHANGDRLDNRRDNLRFASARQNTAHRTKPNKNNSSGHRGVSWDRFRGRWLAKVMVDRKNVHVGRFERREDAVEAVRCARERHFGEFAGTTR